VEWIDRFLLRPVQVSDLEGVYNLATKAGAGMTNLPADRALLKERIHLSLLSFEKDPKKPGDESYFFILEDTQTHKIVGCCGIFASVGDSTPFYSFHVSHEKVIHNDLEMRDENLFLNLGNDYSGVTEIGSLFILATYRKQRLGEFLSRSRYLYMAQHRAAFHDTVIAEMRGHVNSQGRSPFWHALGERFINSDFKTADRMTSAHYNQFIGELLPHTPIPVALLDKAAQECIGKPHEATRGAVRLLEAEGFSCSRYIDVFDGGPTYEIKTDHIRTIAQLRHMKVTSIEPKVSGDLYLCANKDLPFRAVLGSCKVDEQTLILSQKMAIDLHVKIGDTIVLILF
jgi:arginine N-succinyltransferase